MGENKATLGYYKAKMLLLVSYLLQKVLTNPKGQQPQYEEPEDNRRAE